MATTPTSLSLTTIADNSQIIASTHRNSYSSIQTAVNALITFLSSGTANQFVQSGGGTTINWASAYTAYTPTWTASGVAPAIGNGTITGSYLQVGKLVHGLATLTFGSTTTFGTGSYSLSLPVAAAGSGFTPIGSVAMSDAGVATYMGAAQLTGGTTVQLSTLASPIAAVTPTAPFTFGTGDLIIVNFTYQAA